MNFIRNPNFKYFIQINVIKTINLPLIAIIFIQKKCYN